MGLDSRMRAFGGLDRAMILSAFPVYAISMYGYEAMYVLHGRQHGRLGSGAHRVVAY
jgi:hypothetical protein